MPTYDEVIEDRWAAAQARKRSTDWHQGWSSEQARWAQLGVCCVHCHEPIRSISEAVRVDDTQLAHRPGCCAVDPSQLLGVELLA